MSSSFGILIYLRIGLTIDSIKIKSEKSPEFLLCEVYRRDDLGKQCRVKWDLFHIQNNNSFSCSCFRLRKIYHRQKDSAYSGEDFRFVTQATTTDMWLTFRFS